MQTNLDQFYKTDKKLETELGVRLEVRKGVFFTLRRFGGWNRASIKAALSQEFKPFAQQIAADTLSEEKTREVEVKVFVKASLVSWDGLKDKNGKDIEFTEAAAIKLLTDLPDLYTELLGHASNKDHYLESLGNFSSPT